MAKEYKTMTFYPATRLSFKYIYGYKKVPLYLSELQPIF